MGAPGRKRHSSLGVTEKGRQGCGGGPGHCHIQEQRGHPAWDTGRKGLGGQRGGWGHAKAFGLDSRGSEEPPKIRSKLTWSKPCLRSCLRTSVLCGLQVKPRGPGGEEGLETTPLWGVREPVLSPSFAGRPPSNGGIWRHWALKAALPLPEAGGVVALRGDSPRGRLAAESPC